MRRTVVLLFFLFGAGATIAQEVEVIKYPQLDAIINAKEDGVKVINFWATWCKPCVEEIGHFEAANKQFRDKGVSVTLVSFDFGKDVEKKVQKFIDKNDLRSRVLVLDETDYNSFIDKVSPSWSGAIPATLIVNSKTGKKQFYEKTFKEGELSEVIEAFIN
ncbi:MAG: TlpA disulfide reductase family protein [Imperialibacter sp.]|uniref:TlpA disulfide reductase family protein n=1 Tax=Imperialibacter sp. TaxID=2038411 RepID=UPI0032EDEB5B